MTETTMLVDDVELVKELYPRLRPDDAAIERYRSAIDNLPPIVVARGRVLVDGYHRWQAHKREKIAEVAAVDLGDLTDAEIFNESIRRNASHGQQLSAADKRDIAGKLWATLAHLPADVRQKEIAELLSVADRTVRDWTKDARADEKRTAQAKAWDMWLDCRTQQDIADELGDGNTRQTVSNWLQNMADLPEFANPPESRQHFDIWQFSTADKDAGNQSYFGAMPPQIVENLLWFYTDPKDSVVVDLFAGSGTTIDVAKRMGRRVWASDISGNDNNPMLPIHQWDATGGWPTDAPSKADLVILDPPYWKQAAGRYSNHPGEMAETTIDDFYGNWAKVVDGVVKHAKRAAYIISPTQLEDGNVVDHATDMIAAFHPHGWRVERRIIVPYQTQQATGQQVEWARKNKRMLKLYRDLVVVSP
jgi:DNA modification methylase